MSSWNLQEERIWGASEMRRNEAKGNERGWQERIGREGDERRRDLKEMKWDKRTARGNKVTMISTNYSFRYTPFCLPVKLVFSPICLYVLNFILPSYVHPLSLPLHLTSLHYSDLPPPRQSCHICSPYSSLNLSSSGFLFLSLPLLICLLNIISVPWCSRLYRGFSWLSSFSLVKGTNRSSFDQITLTLTPAFHRKICSNIQSELSLLLFDSQKLILFWIIYISMLTLAARL